MYHANKNDIIPPKGISLDPKKARIKRFENAYFIGFPFLGSLYAIYYFLSHSLSWIEVSSFIIFYLVGGLGIILGCHRYMTHRSFETGPIMKSILSFMATMSFQGSILRWVADHHRHHKYSDKAWDVHSPKIYLNEYFDNKWLGLFHAHIGWMFDETTTDEKKYGVLILKDPIFMFFTRYVHVISLFSLLLPFMYGYLLGGVEAGVGSLLLGGFVRITATQNITWAINSIGHTWGKQESIQKDFSRNNFVLAIIAIGEGYHNNHHADPRSACTGVLNHQLDITWLIIKGLEKMGLVTKVVEPRNRK